MQNLPAKSDMNRTMSSREIAELTGKRHDNVLRDIRTLENQGAISGRNFALADYTDAQGKPRPEYLLDFNATMTLLVGYGMTYDAAKESLSKRGFKEKAVMENLPMNQSMNLGMNKTMSSREIAELTGKMHKNVIQDIRTLIEQGAIDRLNFQPISYKDSYGREQPEYLLDFDATMTLVTGYNAVLRAKVIKRWRELEEGTAQPITQTQPMLLTEDRKDAIAFESYLSVAKLCGFTGNQALLKANRAVEKTRGVSLLKLLDVTLETPNKQALLTPTEIGRRFEPAITPVAVNRLLEEMGLQCKEPKPIKGYSWRPTEKGEVYGTYVEDTKKYCDGTVQYWKWYESVVEALSQYLDELAE